MAGPEKGRSRAENTRLGPRSSFTAPPPGGGSILVGLLFLRLRQDDLPAPLDLLELKGGLHLLGLPGALADGVAGGLVAVDLHVFQLVLGDLVEAAALGAEL